MRIKQWLWRATAELRCRVVILMYHRVFETASDPWELCVSPGHFAEHLEVLDKNYQVISLNELVRSLRVGQLPERGVVLTFDDGYADNLWNAKPLLEKYELPATVFITSGSLDSPAEFWWDDLERILLQPRKLPKRLQLSVQGRTHDLQTTNSDERQLAYMAIHRILQPLRSADRDQAMSDLFVWSGVDPTGRIDYRPLTTAELIQLAQCEVVDIGAHTVTHPLLSVMPQTDQSAEIVESRKKLEDLLGGHVDTFSYPYGNLSAETVGIVAAAGFETALTTNDSAVRVRANPLRLGRFGVSNWDGDRFKHRLEGFFRS